MISFRPPWFQHTVWLWEWFYFLRGKVSCSVTLRSTNNLVRALNNEHGHESQFQPPRLEAGRMLADHITFFTLQGWLQKLRITSLCFSTLLVVANFLTIIDCWLCYLAYLLNDIIAPTCLESTVCSWLGCSFNVLFWKVILVSDPAPSWKSWPQLFLLVNITWVAAELQPQGCNLFLRPAQQVF